MLVLTPIVESVGEDISFSPFICICPLSIFVIVFLFLACRAKQKRRSGVSWLCANVFLEGKVCENSYRLASFFLILFSDFTL